VSFYGDNHPVYAGSVVKAMSSARDGYSHVVKAFEGELRALDPSAQPARDAAWTAMRARLDDQLQAVVHEVRRLTPTIVEVVVRAPLASKKFTRGSSTGCRTSRCTRTWSRARASRWRASP
jgi:hypothetical protein